MNNGAFGENFPYSNFHDLNMDWIIKIAKDFLDQYTHIQETIDQGIDDLNAKAEELENILQELSNNYSEELAQKAVDALRELDADIAGRLAQFNIDANNIVQEAIASIPADYTDLSRLVNNNKELITQLQETRYTEALYSPAEESAYTSGATSTTSVYFITKNNGTVCLPKGCGIASIRLLNSSEVTHAVCLYLMERIGQNRYRVHAKYPNLTIDNSRYLNIAIKPANVDLFIGIRQENAYGLKYTDGTFTGGDTGLVILYSGDPAVDETISPTIGDFNRAYNVEIIGLMTPRFNGCVTAPNTIPLKNINITDEVDWYENKGFSNTSIHVGETITTYQNNLTDSQAGATSHPILIRDNDGTLLYNIQSLNSSGYPEAFTYLEFDIYGRFLRTLTQSEFDTNGFSSDAYYVALRKYYSYNTQYVISPVNVEWIAGAKNEYTVGANGDFTTFTEALRTLANDTREKTIYIEEGIYDIYAEKGGASYIQSITNPASLNWRDVSEVVPPNTTIIGKGRVVLQFEPPAEVIGSDEMAFLFSPLNVSGSCHIENIEIWATNCRYAIHDETSSRPEFNYVRRSYKNVRASKRHGTYGNDQCYAAGIAPNGVYDFDNCVFYNDRNWTFSMHSTTMQENDKVTVNMNNCVIYKHGDDTYHSDVNCMGFGNTHTSPRNVNIELNNTI